MSENTVFDASWRELCTVSHVGREQVDWMVRAHYLGTWPGVVVCTLGMAHGPFTVGTLIFALPPAQTSVRLGGETWELARLWIKDDVPRNAETWLIGQAIKHVRRDHPQVEFLVSYADPTQGHQGVIYQASNWLSDGMTDAGRKTPRHDYLWRGKKYSRMGHLPSGATPERVPRISKHRYIYPLRAKQARAMQHGKEKGQ